MSVMNELYYFHKIDKASFKIKEDALERIGMPDMAKGPMDIVDDIPTGYDDPRWIEKSDSVKARDNYTCQLCHAFNPMQDCLVYIQQGEYETYHHYYWAGNSRYDIHVKEYNLTINIDFYPGFHLAVPRLNVHHKIYYRNRHLWDYPDDCLVTLCQDCHHYVHSLNDIGIPIVEKNSTGQTILIGKTRPKPYLPQIDHTDLGTFKPLALVEENRWGLGLKGQDLKQFRQAKNDNKQGFDYHEVLDNHVLHISFFKCYDPRINKHTPEEIKKVADFIIMDFIKNILGFSKKNM